MHIGGSSGDPGVNPLGPADAPSNPASVVINAERRQTLQCDRWLNQDSDARMKSVNAKTTLSNCEVLGTDADQASHVSQSTHSIASAASYARRNTDENPVRVREVSRRRADKTGVRPL